LLFSGTNGSAAIHGPAIVDSYHSQRKLAELIASSSDGNMSIGGAIYSAMHALSVNHANAILNWSLLADPTLPMQ